MVDIDIHHCHEERGRDVDAIDCPAQEHRAVVRALGALGDLAARPARVSTQRGTPSGNWGLVPPGGPMP